MNSTLQTPRGVATALLAAVLVAGLGERAAGSPAAIDSARATAPRTATQPRFDGEYGLFVRFAGEALEVRWLTAREAPGYLRALTQDGTVLEDRETPTGIGHLVSFPRPAVPSVILEYGAREDEEDRHRTRIWLTDGPPVETPSYAGIDSLFVLGDLHGEFDTLVELLQQAGLIDPKLRWSAGHSHLVLLGDLFDRGPDVTRLLWFVYRLERQAAAAGGRVHTVLGNHEIMIMTNDLRYVSGKEFLVAQRHQAEYSDLFNPRTSVLGRWLASKPALLRIDDALFAHGGVTPEYATYSLRDFQDSLTTFLSEELFLHWTDSVYWEDSASVAAFDSAALLRRYRFFFVPASVFWYRGYVRSDTLAAPLSAVLRHFESVVHVVGHTPLPAIVERYEGSLIAVDLDQPATQMLLLVRSEQGLKRYRYTLSGSVEPL